MKCHKCEKQVTEQKYFDIVNYVYSLANNATGDDYKEWKAIAKFLLTSYVALIAGKTKECSDEVGRMDNLH